MSEYAQIICLQTQNKMFDLLLTPLETRAWCSHMLRRNNTNKPQGGN